jgi:hypothetical protein
MISLKVFENIEKPFCSKVMLVFYFTHTFSMCILKSLKGKQNCCKYTTGVYEQSFGVIDVCGLKQEIAK